MSQKKSKSLRLEFEKKYGFSREDRDGELYKATWRKYKKEAIK